MTYEVCFLVFFSIATYHSKKLQVDCLSNYVVFTGQASRWEISLVNPPLTLVLLGDLKFLKEFSVIMECFFFSFVKMLFYLWTICHRVSARSSTHDLRLCHDVANIDEICHMLYYRSKLHKFY